MKKYLLLFIPLFCLIIVVSCTKSSRGTSGCTLSATTIVGKYTVTAIQFTPSTGPLAGIAVDGLTFVNACDKDNIYALNSNGTATITDTGTPVECSPPDDAAGTWLLSGTTFTSSAHSLSGTISSFSCTNFTLTGDTTIAGYSGVAKITFTRQ